MYAMISISWDSTFEVPVAEMGKFVEMVNKYPRVSRDWDGKDPYFYIIEQRIPTVELSDKRAEMYKREKVAEEPAKVE
jgi:hypothetical protein